MPETETRIAETEPGRSPADWLNNPLAMRDATVRVNDAAGWDGGTHEHTKVDDRGRLVLDAPDKAYPAKGVWTSAAFEAAFPLTQVLPSLALDAPESTGVRMLVRLRYGDDWSPWLDLLGWGEPRGTGDGSVTRDDRARVDIDWVRLDDPATAEALQLRLELVSYDSATGTQRQSPAVRKVVAVYSGPLSPEADTVATVEEAGMIERGGASPAEGGGDRVDLPVPWLRQRDNGPALGPQTCSPTSVTMVLGYYGIELEPRAVSEAIYDRRYGLFGNWGRAVMFASTQRTPDGTVIDAELQRFRDWDDVRTALETGAPVIASIRFKAGEFPSNKMKRTNGHLIVVRGLTEDGDAIVNDPAYAEGGDGVVYKKEELARAWLGKGGVGYVIRPRP